MIRSFLCLTFFALTLSCIDSGVYGAVGWNCCEKCRKRGVIHTLGYWMWVITFNDLFELPLWGFKPQYDLMRHISSTFWRKSCRWTASCFCWRWLDCNELLPEDSFVSSLEKVWSYFRCFQLHKTIVTIRIESRIFPMVSTWNSRIYFILFQVLKIRSWDSKGLESQR